MSGNWNCEKCGKLLGKVADGRVTVRNRKSQYTAEAADGTARLQGVCPKCGRLNVLNVSSTMMENSTNQ